MIDRKMIDREVSRTAIGVSLIFFVSVSGILAVAALQQWIAQEPERDADYTVSFFKGQSRLTVAVDCDVDLCLNTPLVRRILSEVGLAGWHSSEEDVGGQASAVGGDTSYRVEVKDWDYGFSVAAEKTMVSFEGKIIKTIGARISRPEEISDTLLYLTTMLSSDCK